MNKEYNIDELRKALPLADCQNCLYQEPLESGWCYMFLEYPGKRCGQFKAIIIEDVDND